VPSIPSCAYRAVLVSHPPFSASLAHDEAVLRFPYDEGLRQLLRAIPGRRWDPLERAWCIPLGPEQAEALARLLAALPGEPDVSEALARTIARRRARRSRRECLLDLVRPDEDWWLSFATDVAPEAVAALLEHPDARELPRIGRGLVPLDERARRLIKQLRAQDSGVRLSEVAARALVSSDERAGEGATPSREQVEREAPRYDVEFRRDRRGEHWILIGSARARLARVLAAQAGLRALEGPAGTLGLAAIEHDAEQLLALLAQLEDISTDPRVSAWLRRATTWRGNVEVQGPAEAPQFLLLGDFARLPRGLREHATTAPGGAIVPLSLESLRLIEAQLEGWMSPAARRCAAALKEGRPAPPAVLERSTVDEATFVLAPGHGAELLDAFASLRGVLAPASRRSAGAEHSRLPAIRADPFCVPELDRFLAAHEIWIEPEALALLQEIREQHARSAGLVGLSAATDAPLRAVSLGGELKPFQRAGVSYLLAQRRAFLADEQGLGKTIEALATVEADGAYPAIVVCPASLKLNWQRELERWLPQRTVELLRGVGGAAEPQGTSADITVVNYDIVAARLSQLCALRPRALVLDESHHCKNAAAKRTQAVQRLSAVVPRDGLVLALSGTPVINRPAELISQLRILGRLEDFGSGVQFGARFRGADAHLRLHWHLRARCFVRRLKADVLPQLPPKTRAVVPVELDNEPEYRLAERDVVAWLQSQPLDLRELDAKVAAALRAERLVRLNALKLLAARGKLHAALTWIHDFCATGERLVVFAHHREIRQAVLARFPGALHILGEDSHGARDATLSSFQGPDGPENQLIVCSIEVAGQGLTLTRASNVVFLELDWTPAKHDQAEDRCHRIGQQDAVNASYVLAAGTIDETISTLLEHKRAVIGAVTDGREEKEEGVVDALVRELRGTPYKHLRAVA
jgi:SWI/SNF-related matrix-associated actin-dependent regulator of chromatin subfamily A-like protein 1